ncbi:GGDEF domain-containing response regulator [Thalassomonas actiniarum]|uniref:EAL domain-containing protein n=1 Tax=Thalassomonas actiniarum TaxID=485447 RepID=A0AAE9YX63_9GAMM|nr:GGDEF domain-containing response regulator [Thalassomonas actiniarum]WDE01133.1 EAL domain-containing protein [Thalassomonas actiniarum]
MMHYHTEHFNLLIVEPSEAERALYSTMVRDFGFNVTIFEVMTGQSAVDVIKQNTFGCILLSNELPDMNAQLVLAMIQNGPTLSIPVIVLTSTDLEDLALELMESGATDYIPKNQCIPLVLNKAILYALARAQYRKAQIDFQKAEIKSIEHELLKERNIALEEANEKLQQLAMRDPLTGLPNRNYLKQQLEQTLLHAERARQIFGVLYFDLDYFKYVNDTYGHQVGDELLLAVTKRVKQVIRQKDVLARIGGDEFVLLIDDASEPAFFGIIAAKICRTLRAEFIIQGFELHIACSVGIATYPHSGKDYEELMKNADSAMYRAKESGRNNYKFFSVEMNMQVDQQFAIERDLRLALEQEQLELYYQPKFNLISKEVVGAEALVRWNHPSKGFLRPDSFLEIAGQSELIIDLGDWVRREICRQLAQWQACGLELVRMSINVADKECAKNRVLQNILDQVMHYDIDAKLLELELTEETLTKGIRNEITDFKILERMDIQLAIDDFGTGNTSFQCLKELPIDVLKIDKEFTRQLASNAKVAAITTTIIDLAKRLGISCIAEGVENEEQAAFLRENGCEYAQGYFFSEPLTADNFALLLKKSSYTDNKQLTLQQS